MVTAFHTPGWSGYAVKFLRGLDNRVVFTANQNFGVAGLGKVWVGSISDGIITYTGVWRDALFDVSEVATHQHNGSSMLVTASGDGTSQLWTLHQQLPSGDVSEYKPSAVYGGHMKEWDIEHPEQPLSTFTHHSAYIYCVVFSRLTPHIFCSASGDGSIQYCDTRTPQAPVNTLSRVAEQCSEVLCCDLSPHDDYHVVSGCTDASICTWDMRATCTGESRPVTVLTGHDKAVRRVKFVSSSRFVSCSYDYTVRVWDGVTSNLPLETIEHHTEFVYGLDVNAATGLVADYAWDCRLNIYSPHSLVL